MFFMLKNIKELANKNIFQIEYIDMKFHTGVMHDIINFFSYFYNICAKNVKIILSPCNVMANN